MQHLTRIFGWFRGTRFGFLECDKLDNGSLLNRLRRRGREEAQTVVGAEAFTALTRSVCEEKPRICFRNECWHGKATGGSGRHKRIVRVYTHRACEVYATECDERGAAPLLPARTGDGWEIPYLNASGKPCVARSRTGLFELRVTLELCFETFEEQTEFTQQADRFRLTHHCDAQRHNWVEAKIDKERVYTCELEEGKIPKCFGVPYFYLCSCLALGWLYQVWFDSLTTPVELHLRKTIRKGRASHSGPPSIAAATWEGVGRAPAPAAQTVVKQPSEVQVIIETI